jgi:hypothetical protein
METALVPAAQALALHPGSPDFEPTATHMASEYTQATAELRRLFLAIKEQADRLERAFAFSDGESLPLYKPFEIRIHYGHGNYDNYEIAEMDDDPHPGRTLTGLFAVMKRKAWTVLVEKLGIKNLMSVARRKEFDKQLADGTLPDITAETILGILLGLTAQAQEFAREAAHEVFDLLRPRGRLGSQYKTNDAFRVGRKVVLPWYVTRRYGAGYYVNHNHEQEVTAIDGVFHLLDGKGIMREPRGPLYQAIRNSKDGKGETAYFRFRCFKNCNLHLEFRRLDLVRELNLLATGERVLGMEE